MLCFFLRRTYGVSPRPYPIFSMICCLSCFLFFSAECKNICGTQFSRYLFSARSYMVNYVYYLVCLCFGIVGVKYFAYGLWVVRRSQTRRTNTNEQVTYITVCKILDTKNTEKQTDKIIHVINHIRTCRKQISANAYRRYFCISMWFCV